MVSVKAVTLIFISGRGSALSSAQKGNQVLSIGKELLSCFSHANKRDFQNSDHNTELTFFTPLSVYDKKSYAYVVC